MAKITSAYSMTLRNRLVNLYEKKVLIARLDNSDQANDLTVPANCKGYGRIRHFRMKKGDNWTIDPLPNLPAAKALNTQVEEILRTQLFQLAGCNWRCWYCFVDNKLLSANTNHSEYFHADELIELYVGEKDRPLVIDLSGGQPDLVPEWTLWIMKALEKYGLAGKVFLWSDDNLSTRYWWKYLTDEEQKYMVSFPNYARVACFKGYDDTSFSFNTSAAPELFNEQFFIYRNLLEAGFDMYAYVTFTSAPNNNLLSSMSNFVDRLQEIHPNLPLRTIPLKIEIYSPTQRRLAEKHRLALEFQYEVHQAWCEEIIKRYEERERSIPICDIEMRL